MGVQAGRINQLHAQSSVGKCVLYVMSRDQRVQDNHALLAAQDQAIIAGLPLAVVFCLLPKAGVRAREHYDFMLEGLKFVEASLAVYNIPFMMLFGDPFERLQAAFYHLKPDAVYFDFNPLRGPQKLLNAVAQHANFGVYVVDTHNVVPIWAASNKREYAARTIRPKIHKILAEYLIEPPKLIKHPIKWQGPIIKINKLTSQINEVLNSLKTNNTNIQFASGEDATKLQLNNFIKNRLTNYAKDRNEPTKNGLSGFSPYLHFGQISSLRIALQIMSLKVAPESVNVLLEEMIIRKELSDNWCYYNQNYDQLKGAPQWAINTLEKHSNDSREYLYNLQDFAQAKTHDQAWNAAQKQLTSTGNMHGYMRMYWAKKVLEWSPSADQAIKTLNYLNDFYSLDGGDPNGYAGIMWSVAGVHDRAWGERPVSGTIRPMVYNGLKRKFAIVNYINRFSS